MIKHLIKRLGGEARVRASEEAAPKRDAPNEDAPDKDESNEVAQAGEAPAPKEGA